MCVSICFKVAPSRGCLPALRGCLPALQGCLPALGYQVFRKKLFWEPGNHIPRKNLIPGLPRLIPQKGRGKKTASFLVRTKYQICRLTGNFDPSKPTAKPGSAVDTHYKLGAGGVSEALRLKLQQLDNHIKCNSA